MAGFSRRISVSNSATAKRNRADHAADSAKITRESSRSTAPVTCASNAAGSLALSHSRQSAWLCLCCATRPSADCEERLNNALTDCTLRETPGGGLPIREDSSLFRLKRLGILQSADRGKPVERRGRKATGLKRRAMTAGLPARRKVFETEQGGERPVFSHLRWLSATHSGNHVLPEQAA